MRLYDLKTNRMTAPVIDTAPSFSWKIRSEERNVLQTAYRITVRNGAETVWDTGEILSRDQSFIAYDGLPLRSRTEYLWQVTAWDNQGNSAAAESSFKTALLYPEDWSAKWASCPFVRENAAEYRFGAAHPAVWFERSFTLSKPVHRATVYATAQGVYRLLVNGQRPDDREFAPEFTPYEKRLCYQAYDVTGLLRAGENEWTMIVGDGWYFSAQAGPVMERPHVEPSILLQMEITYADGETACFGSDERVTCRTGFIRYSDLYQGEKQDFTLPEGERVPVLLRDYGTSFLELSPMPKISAVREIPAKRICTSPKGEQIVDFGQLLAGRARIRIDLPRGREASFEYFEIPDREGNYLNTMFAPQKDTVISGGVPFVHEALFTFHGFRYIRVTGMENARPEDFTAVLLSTEKENAGAFDCSDPRLNRLYQNVRFSQSNNMMSVPTDCPSREKAGWTGDILIYAKTALMNEEMTPFLTSWLRSVRADQAEDGVVKIVSPYMRLYDGLLRSEVAKYGDRELTGVAGWSDAVVWVPYEMYRVTGNTAVLRENFDAMDLWCGWILRRSAERRGAEGIPEEYDRWLWNTGFHFGEWLVPSRKLKEGEGPYDAGKDSAYYVAPFFGYMTVKKMGEICRVLQETAKAEFYEDAAEQIREAIRHGIIEAGRMPEKLMGAYILAFAFGLVPKEYRASYHKRLVQLLHENSDCLDTGFLATPFLLDVLCDLGETELAARVLLQTKRPSWLYEVEQGATAIWEAWDADEARDTGRFVSFDHYAFGCVDDFLCRRVAGLDSDTPGFGHLVIRPVCDLGLSYCCREFVSEAGPISVYWNRSELRLELPPNTTATVHWDGRVTEVGSGSWRFAKEHAE